MTCPWDGHGAKSESEPPAGPKNRGAFLLGQMAKSIFMFIVIETHGGPEYAAIVTDENGNNKVFETIEEAQAEADDCQDGKIFEI